MESILPSADADAIEEAEEAEFDGIELDIAGPQPTDDPLWTPAERLELRQRASERDIEIPSLCLGFLNRTALADDDSRLRAEGRASIIRAIDAAKVLDADTILLPFFGNAELETEEDRRRVVDALSRVTEAATTADVTLAIENTLSPVENQELLDQIDSPAVGIYYDIGNAIVYGHHPVEGIKELQDDIARVHVKDWNDDGPQMIGEGDVDMTACANALADIGYDDWIVLETTSEEDQLDDAVENLRRVREYFA